MRICLFTLLETETGWETRVSKGNKGPKVSCLVPDLMPQMHEIAFNLQGILLKVTNEVPRIGKAKGYNQWE